MKTRFAFFLSALLICLSLNAQTTVFPKTTIFPKTTVMAAGSGGATTPCSVFIATTGANGQQCTESDLGLTCTSGCSNGNAITTIADQTSNHNDWITCGAACPIYESAQLNGKPSGRLDGSTNKYEFTTKINCQSGCTEIVVLKRNSASGDMAYTSGDAGSLLYWGPCSAAASEQGWYNTGGGQINNGTAACDTSWHSMIATFLGSAAGGSSPFSVFSLGGASDGTGTNDRTITANETSFGYYQPAGNSFFGGDWAFHAIANRVLTSGEKTTIQTELTTYYGAI